MCNLEKNVNEVVVNENETTKTEETVMKTKWYRIDKFVWTGIKWSGKQIARPFKWFATTTVGKYVAGRFALGNIIGLAGGCIATTAATFFAGPICGACIALPTLAFFLLDYVAPILYIPLTISTIIATVWANIAFACWLFAACQPLFWVMIGLGVLTALVVVLVIIGGVYAFIRK